MNPTRIFISYSSLDRTRAESIHSSLDRAGFAVWRDLLCIDSEWSREIAYALADSDLLCLIWSANSATSKWVKREWLTARALEKLIIPCIIPDAPDLPEPLYNLHGIVFKEIEEGCAALVQKVNETKSFVKDYDYTILPQNSYIPFNPNPRFTGRNRDLLDLYLNMIGNLNNIGINQVGIVGMGGVGKTQLIVEFAYRFSHEFHAVYWVQGASPDNWFTEYMSIAKNRLKQEIKDFDKLANDPQVLFGLQEYFKSHPNTLVVMDNVTEPMLLNNETYISGFTPLTLGCNLLFTTRRRFELPGVTSQAINVFTADAAFKLLTSYRSPMLPEDEGHTRAICEAIGFLPLAITLVGAFLKKYALEISFAEYHVELLKKKLATIDIGKMTKEDLTTRHEATVKATLEDHWRMLKDDEARILFRLSGQFPEALVISKARLGLLAGIQVGSSKLDQPLARVFNELHDLCLIELLEGDSRVARLHPLVREFSNQLVPSDELDSFRSEAARRLNDALFEYTRLDSEVRCRGMEEVLVDLDTAIEWWGNDGERLQELTLLRSALCLSANVVSTDNTQLPSQLLGRLLDQDYSGILHLLQQCREWKFSTWLCPLRNSLIGPNGSLKYTLHGHDDWVTDVVLTPDDKWIISASRDGSIHIWNLANGLELPIIFPKVNEYIANLSVSADGKYVRAHLAMDPILYSILPEHNEYIDESNSPKIKTLRWKLPSSGLATLCDVIESEPEELYLYSSSYRGKYQIKIEDKVIRLCDSQTGAELYCMTGHSGDIMNVAISTDEKCLVSCSKDTSIRVWDLDAVLNKPKKMPHVDIVSSAGVTADGNKGISLARNVIKVWDMSAGALFDTIEWPQEEPVLGAGLGPDGAEVYLILENSIVACNLHEHNNVRTLGYEPMQIVMQDYCGPKRVANPGNVVPITTSDKFLVLQTAYPNPIDGPRTHYSLPFVFPLDYKIVLRIWDAEQSVVRLERTIHSSSGRGHLASMTPDGRIAVSDDSLVWSYPDTKIGEWSIFVWDVEDGKQPFYDSVKKSMKDMRFIEEKCEGEKQKLVDFKGKVTVLAISPDGRFLVSAAEDLVLRLWDLQNGHQITCFTGDSVFTSCAISSEGRVVIAGDSSGQVHLLALHNTFNTHEGRNV